MTKNTNKNPRKQSVEKHGAIDISIGISACLLGQKVRYNGDHKLDRFIRGTLGAYVRFIPICPEVDIGLGVPRETLDLVRGNANHTEVRLMASKSLSDHTKQMQTYAKKRLKQLISENLSGYILKKESPSCGMERVSIYGQSGIAPVNNGRGLFAQALMDGFPNLPIEENGRLEDASLRENFIERIFAYCRLRTLFGRRWKIGDLVTFHTHEKLRLLAHDRIIYDKLGRLVASAQGRDRKEIANQYQSLFMTGLRKIATRSKHTNVLQHIAGHFKKLIDSSDKQEIQEVIAKYHAGQLPLIVPVTLLQHHVQRHDIDYLRQQTYLDPHPAELMLRNHG